MKARNKKAAQELISTYRGITIEQIKEKWVENPLIPLGSRTAKMLTGFSGNNTCTLCLAVGHLKHKCDYCIYGTGYGCLQGKHSSTYYDIYYANTPEKLLNAFRARADHIENLLKTIE